MKGSTHLAAGCITALALQADPTLAVTAGIAIGSLLPDIDSRASLVGRHIPILPRLLKHRTVTHSLWLALVIYFACKPIAVGMLTHILLDLLNPEGLYLLWPWRKKFRVPVLCELLPSGGFIDRTVGWFLWGFLIWAAVSLATNHAVPFLPHGRPTLW